MKTFKEKFKEFKGMNKKEKARKIIDIIFYCIVGVIATILIISYICYNPKKQASADYRPEGNEMGFEYPETPEIELPSIKRGARYDGTLNYESGTYVFPTRKSLIFNTFIITDTGRWECKECISMQVEKEGTYVVYYLKDASVVTQILFIVNSSDNSISNIRVRKSNGTYAEGSDVNEISIARMQPAPYNDYQTENLVKILWAASYSSIYGKEYDKGFRYGYENAGGITQEQLDVAYNNGYVYGYNVGLSETNNSFNPIGMIITPVAEFFTVKLFGDFSIGSFFTVTLFVSVALIFLKIFAGG